MKRRQVRLAGRYHGVCALSPAHSTEQIHLRERLRSSCRPWRLPLLRLVYKHMQTRYASLTVSLSCSLNKSPVWFILLLSCSTKACQKFACLPCRVDNVTYMNEYLMSAHNTHYDKSVALSKCFIKALVPQVIFFIFKNKLLNCFFRDNLIHKYIIHSDNSFPHTLISLSFQQPPPKSLSNTHDFRFGFVTTECSQGHLSGTLTGAW